MNKLTSETINELNLLASKIIVKKENVPYVDIVTILKKFDFEVEVSELFLNTMSVCISFNSQKKILVNSSMNSMQGEDLAFRKMRFVTAYEFSYYLIYKRDDIGYLHRTGIDNVDKKANYLARAILMPEEVFRDFYIFSKYIDIKDNHFHIELLAKCFKLERKQIQARIIDLHL